MLLYFLSCFVIATSAFPEGHIDSENVTVAAEHGAGGRIAGGEDHLPLPRRIPFQAQITREGATFCSGTIVSYRHILTAAHCVEGARPRELTVRIGSIIRGKGLVVPIEEIVQHPNYDYPQNNFDIAYMRTVKEMSFSRRIQPIIIANLGSPVPNKVHVTGWGYQEDNQKKLADKVRSVDLPVISNTECQVFYPMMSITKNMFCLYSLRDMDKGTCEGDGGDPAVARNRLYGVSSATRGCGPGMGPSVFTYIGAEEIRSFIINNIYYNGKPSQRPGYSAERPEKHPDESPEGPSERPEEESAKRPDRTSKCPEKHPDERPEKAVKSPESDSENPEECPEKAVRTPESDSENPEDSLDKAIRTAESDSENPEECLDKAVRTPESDSENPEECLDKAVRTPESDSENSEEWLDKAVRTPESDSENPEECLDKAVRTPKSDSENPECPDKAVRTPESDSENPEECLDKAVRTPESDSENPEECPEKAAKTPESDSEHPEECPDKAVRTPESDSENPEECPEKGYDAERPGDASKRPEKPPDMHHEKVPKTPAEGSDSDEERPGDASNRPAGVPDYPEERPGDLLSKRPEENPADRPEELSKGPQRQSADRPQKRPAEREP